MEIICDGKFKFKREEGEEGEGENGSEKEDDLRENRFEGVDSLPHRLQKDLEQLDLEARESESLAERRAVLLRTSRILQSILSQHDLSPKSEALFRAELGGVYLDLCPRVASFSDPWLTQVYGMGALSELEASERQRLGQELRAENTMMQEKLELQSDASIADSEASGGGGKRDSMALSISVLDQALAQFDKSLALHPTVLALVLRADALALSAELRWVLRGVDSGGAALRDLEALFGRALRDYRRAEFLLAEGGASRRTTWQLFARWGRCYWSIARWIERLDFEQYSREATSRGRSRMPRRGEDAAAVARALAQRSLSPTRLDLGPGPGEAAAGAAAGRALMQTSGAESVDRKDGGGGGGGVGDDGDGDVVALTTEQAEWEVSARSYANYEQAVRRLFLAFAEGCGSDLAESELALAAWLDALVRMSSIRAVFPRVEKSNPMRCFSTLDHYVTLACHVLRGHVPGVADSAAPGGEWFALGEQALPPSWLQQLRLLALSRHSGAAGVALDTLGALAAASPEARNTHADVVRALEAQDAELRAWAEREIERMQPMVKQDLREAGLSFKQDILPNWNVVVNCIYFHSGAKVRPFPFPDYDSRQRELREISRSRASLRHSASGARKPQPARAELNAEIEHLLTPKNPRTVYTDWKAIGKGAYGEVFSARRGKYNVAIKMMNGSDPVDHRCIVKEIQLLDAARHPNVVSFLKCYYHSNMFWVVMEHCEGGTLSRLRRKHQFSDPEIAYICRELLRALEFLHSKNYVHRDLKCSNVLLTTEGEIKLADLGLTDEIPRGSVRRSMAGSRNFMAPEMIVREGYDSKLDIWSFGCMVLEVVDRPPYQGEPALRVLFKLATGGAPPDPPGPRSAIFLDFLHRCLIVSPFDRPSASELLLHPFLQLACDRSAFKKLLEKANIRDSLSLTGII